MLTARMWRGIIFVGVVMAIGTLLVLYASLPGGYIDGTGNLPYAQTLAFTTLMLFEIFNVINSRSDERSAFVHLFTNGRLWAAIGGSSALQVLVVYAPFLQSAFGTIGLTATDWMFCIGVAEFGAVAQRSEQARRARDTLELVSKYRNLRCFRSPVSTLA